MRILGISAYYHDSAAALLVDGEPVAAAQEERFTRRKHDRDFPAHALRYCLEAAGVTLDQLDAVIYYEDPALKFRRLVRTFLAYAPDGAPFFHDAAPRWLEGRLWQRRRIAEAFGAGAPEKPEQGMRPRGLMAQAITHPFGAVTYREPDALPSECGR